MKDPKGYHVAQRVNLVGIVVRTDKVTAATAELDRSDRARYKGLLVMPDPSYTAIQLMVVGTLSRRYGWEFYEKLRANEIMIVQSHQQVSETLTRGERLIAAEGADQFAWLDRKAGHKMASVFPTDGAFAIGAPTVVIKGAPHPNAAKAFAEFMISDTVQRLFPGEGIYAGPLGRRAAARQSAAVADQADAGGLRADREGQQDAQDALQRHLPVGE